MEIENGQIENRRQKKRKKEKKEKREYKVIQAGIIRYQVFLYASFREQQASKYVYRSKKEKSNQSTRREFLPDWLLSLCFLFPSSPLFLFFFFLPSRG